MITDTLRGLLRKRFRHYRDDAVLGFEADDQPGITSVKGTTYPALLLRNDVFWFLAREARPADDEGRSLKSKAPTGNRNVLVDDANFDELVVVEGEGDAIAMRLVGYAGIAIAGGVNNLLSESAAALADRKAVFAGKAVRILFDDDEAGRRGAVKVARRLLEDGATRVAIVSLTGHSDVEDWLESFEKPDEALRELTHLIGSAQWETDSGLAAQDKKNDDDDVEEIPTLSTRVYVPGDPIPRLLALTFERRPKKIALAKFGPLVEPKLAAPTYGDAAGIFSEVARGWSVANQHVVDGKIYYADGSEAILEYLRNGTLVLPPPPSESEVSSVELWISVRRFIERWVVVPEFAPDVMTAYAFLTWRLEDAAFRRVPYLRFFGPPGSGKGRALDVMRQICWRTFSTQPSTQNLHRLIDFLGDVTLVVDEFHVDGMRGEHQQQLIDMLCLGYDRTQPVARVTQAPKGRGETIRNFKLFGPKVFAGYGADEHEALARRSVTVEMLPGADVPPEMSPLDLPDAFFDEGERLRADLLAWRGRNLAKGLPDATAHPHSKELIDRAGMEVGQVFFPLIAMIPESLDDVRETVLAYAEGRRVAVRDTRAVTDDAYLLEAFVNTACGPFGYFFEGAYFASTQAIFAECVGTARGDSTAAVVGRRLKSLGFKSHRPAGVGRHRYYMLDPRSAAHARVLERNGVSLPATSRAKPMAPGADGSAGL